MITIRRIGVTSAMKVGALLVAVQTALFGLLFFLLPSMVFTSVMTNLPQTGSGGSFGGSAAFGTIGLVSGLISYMILIAFGVIAGAIGGALTAFFYNLVAGWIGGLQVEVDGLYMLDDKLKRDYR